MNISRTKAVVAGVAMIVIVVIATIYAFRSGADHRSPDKSSPQVTAVSPSNARKLEPDDKKPLYWHDPMVPATRFDKPGKSPFMDMQLVPVYAEAGAESRESNGVTVSSRAQQNLGVRTAEVVMGSLASRTEAVGSVDWNERDVAVISARANGYVEKLYVRAAYDPIAKGQALASLYVPEWIAAQEEFLSVRRMSNASSDLQTLVDGARQRMRLVGMDDAQIARVAASNAVQARVSVTSPVAGVLAELAVREGSTVTTGMPIARINGLSTVWVNAEVPESLAASMQPGASVEVKGPAGNTLVGKVAAILPNVNATTRTLKVRVELANANRQLIPGMFATLRFAPSARGDVLLIPSEALIATGTRNLVMVADANGRFVPTAVEPGIESNGKTEITKGLKAGQRVVLSGQFLLDSEASIKGVEARQSASTEAGDTSSPAPSSAPSSRVKP